MQHTSVFVETTPVAVFSILADVESRARVITTVRKVALSTRPPVGRGTRFREWRRALVPGWGCSYVIGEFTPPDRFSLLRWQAGIRMEAAFRLHAEHGGTQINVAVSARCPLWPWFPTSILADVLAVRWARRLQADLADIKRHASMRANPNWRDSITCKGAGYDR